MMVFKLRKGLFFIISPVFFCKIKKIVIFINCFKRDAQYFIIKHISLRTTAIHIKIHELNEIQNHIFLGLGILLIFFFLLFCLLFPIDSSILSSPPSPSKLSESYSYYYIFSSLAITFFPPDLVLPPWRKRLRFGAEVEISILPMG